MTREEQDALREIKRRVSLGWIEFTRHALDVMEIYDVLEIDVRDMLLGAAAASAQENGRFYLAEAFETGETFALIVELASHDAIVVTFMAVEAS